MKQNIESFLFEQDGQHLLGTLTFSETDLTMAFDPCISGERKVYTFKSSTIRYIDTLNTDNPRKIEFPLDVIGISAIQRESCLWAFCFHCNDLEFAFDSEWPCRK